MSDFKTSYALNIKYHLYSANRTINKVKKISERERTAFKGLYAQNKHAHLWRLDELTNLNLHEI